jgi:hypothetical protein
MTSRVAQALAATAFAAFAVTGIAQQPAAAPAAPSSAPIPQHTCGKPSEYPGNLASDNQKRTWQKDYVTYIDCVKKFIEEQQALAEPHVKASNAAINEYNAAVKSYNETVQKANEK